MHTMQDLLMKRQDLQDQIATLQHELQMVENAIKKDIFESQDLDFLRIDWTRLNRAYRTK